MSTRMRRFAGWGRGDLVTGMSVGYSARSWIEVSFWPLALLMMVLPCWLFYLSSAYASRRAKELFRELRHGNSRSP